MYSDDLKKGYAPRVLYEILLHYIAYKVTLLHGALKLIAHIVVLKQDWEARTNAKDQSKIQPEMSNMHSICLSGASRKCTPFPLHPFTSEFHFHTLPHPPFGLWVPSWCGFFLHIMLANNDCCPTYHYRCQTLNAPCWLVLILILEYKLYLFKTKVSKLYRLYILLCSNTVWVYDTIFNATLKTDIWLTGPIKEYGSFNHYLASVKRDLVR